MKNFLCKQLKHTKFITALSLFLLHSAGYSAVTTNGYWNAGTINGVSFPANGTGVELISPEKNPDEFCKLQGAGWRLPLMAEYNVSYKNKPPLSNTFYANNGEHTLRRVGSLVSEWGGNPSLNIGSGWKAGLYWLAEPANTTSRHYGLMNDINAGSLSYYLPTFTLNVACAITL